MRVRKSTGEIVWTLDEFRALDAAAICRRMNLGGGEWLDAERDHAADRAVLSDMRSDV